MHDRPMQSPPARGRGLKQLSISAIGLLIWVAPRAGAWIETAPRSIHRRVMAVAPRAGAWIETSLAAISTDRPGDVAPRAGAWIETLHC